MIYQTNKNTIKRNNMNTFNTIVMVAQLTIFTAFLVNVVRLIHSVITNK